MKKQSTPANGDHSPKPSRKKLDEQDGEKYGWYARKAEARIPSTEDAEPHRFSDLLNEATAANR